MNDINYLEAKNVEKTDSISGLLLEINNKNLIIEKKDNQISNKNTGLWIQGGVNFVLGIITLVFSK